jgi:hypothetical protein
MIKCLEIEILLPHQILRPPICEEIIGGLQHDNVIEDVRECCHGAIIKRLKMQFHGSGRTSFYAQPASHASGIIETDYHV